MSDPEFRLPVGCWADGTHHGTAVLAMPPDDLRAELACDGSPPAAWTTSVLAACTASVGGRPVTPERVRDLPLGDREALLLATHERLHGGDLSLLVDCPACGDTLAAETNARDLLVEPGRAPQARHRVPVDGSVVHFRLPTGADQEAAAGAPTVEAGVVVLLERIVTRVEGERPDDGRLLDALEPLVAELDPQAEIRLAMECPSCGSAVDAHLDAATHLRHAMRRRADEEMHEVHVLAAAYHWSERDILALPPTRRRRYIDLIHRVEGAMT